MTYVYVGNVFVCFIGQMGRSGSGRGTECWGDHQSQMSGELPLV